MFLVIVGRADMVDQVVPYVLRAKRTPSRLFYSIVVRRFDCVHAADSMTFLPDQIIKHSKQNSCEHSGINARSTIACKQIVQWSSSTSASSSRTGSSFSAFGDAGSRFIDIEDEAVKESRQK